VSAAKRLNCDEVMQILRFGGVNTLYVSDRSLYLMHSVILRQWRERRIGMI